MRGRRLDVSLAVPRENEPSRRSGLPHRLSREKRRFDGPAPAGTSILMAESDDPKAHSAAKAAAPTKRAGWDEDAPVAGPEAKPESAPTPKPKAKAVDEDAETNGGARAEAAKTQDSEAKAEAETKTEPKPDADSEAASDADADADADA